MNLVTTQLAIEFLKTSKILATITDEVYASAKSKNPDVTEEMRSVFRRREQYSRYLQSPTASLLRDDLLITINIYYTEHVCAGWPPVR